MSVEDAELSEASDQAEPPAEPATSDGFAEGGDDGPGDGFAEGGDDGPGDGFDDDDGDTAGQSDDGFSGGAHEAAGNRLEAADATTIPTATDDVPAERGPDSTFAGAGTADQRPKDLAGGDSEAAPAERGSPEGQGGEPDGAAPAEHPEHDDQRPPAEGSADATDGAPNEAAPADQREAEPQDEPGTASPELAAPTRQADAEPAELGAPPGADAPPTKDEPAPAPVGETAQDLGSPPDSPDPGPPEQPPAHDQSDPVPTVDDPQREVWSRYPDEFDPPAESDLAAMPSDLPPHSPPEDFVAHVNDGGPDQPGRDVNCLDCSRAVQRTWDGHPEVSASRRDPDSDGEPPDRLTEWTGVTPVPQTFAQIEAELQAAGPGSTAMIVSAWNGSGGHAYNAINDAGTIKFVDAQPHGGAVDTWPPKETSPGYGFTEADIKQTWAWYLRP